MTADTLLYPPTPLVLPPLRIGIVVDGVAGEPWLRTILDQLAACPFVTVAIATPASPPARQPGRFSGLLARVWARLRGRPAGRDAPSTDSARSTDVAAPRAGDFDLLFRFGPDMPSSDMLRAARYGVWSFRHDARIAGRGGPAMVWEASGGNPTAAGGAIGPAWPARPRARRSIASVTGCLRRLYLLRDAGLPPEQDGGRAARAPGARLLVRAVGRSVAGHVTNQATRVQWFLAWRRDPARFIANTDRADMSGFVPIRPPPDEFWADPSVITREGRDFVFFERYRYRSRRGEIAAFAFSDSGRPEPPQTALSCDHHLSNPFIFEWEGQVFMIPESAEASAVRLFRAETFPTGWRHERDLLTGTPMVDATLHCHERRWYMFVNISETGAAPNEDLFLFHADTPLGPWRPHAQNPVKSDVRSARPAGRLFRRGAVLIRPSQDCSIAYGYAINLCEVDELSPLHYRERVVERIEPTWKPRLLGCHTLSASATCEVVDAKRRILRRPTLAGWSPLH